MIFEKNAKFDEIWPLLPEYVHRGLIPDNDAILNTAAKVRIAQVRVFYGVPKTTLAKMLGTSYRQYLRYEGGDSVLPVSVISSLAIFYNLSADFLCGLCDTPSTIYKGEPMEVNGYRLTEYWCTAEPQLAASVSAFGEKSLLSAFRNLTQK